MDKLTNEYSTRTYVVLVLFLLAGSVLILQLMNRPWLHPSGTLKLWEGDIYSSHISQHLTDWYIFTHVVHGLLLYGLLRLVLPDLPVGTRLVIAVGIEAGWEIFENTEFVIRYYRDNTVAVKFYGDTIINSLMDQLAMILGFLTARKVPVYLSVLILISTELFLLYYTRDSLVMNIIMLIYPMEAVKEWQMAGLTVPLHLITRR